MQLLVPSWPPQQLQQHQESVLATGPVSLVSAPECQQQKPNAVRQQLRAACQAVRRCWRKLLCAAAAAAISRR
jgi:hypothetical protein